jgi:hypothetical protein
MVLVTILTGFSAGAGKETAPAAVASAISSESRRPFWWNVGAAVLTARRGRACYKSKPISQFMFKRVDCTLSLFAYSAIGTLLMALTDSEAFVAGPGYPLAMVTRIGSLYANSILCGIGGICDDTAGFRPAVLCLVQPLLHE